MATIDRDALLYDLIMNTPPIDQNCLCEEDMMVLAEKTIALVGDDSLLYGEVACKTLRAIASVNIAKSSMTAGIKRQKSGDREVEKFNSKYRNPWKDYIASLSNLCPIVFGYSLPSALGMNITSGEEIIIPEYVNTQFSDPPLILVP